MATLDCPYLVRHCNARTDYVLIAHPFQPESCPECVRIEAVVTGQRP